MFSRTGYINITFEVKTVKLFHFCLHLAMWSLRANSESDEVCLIDSGIRTLQDVPLHLGVFTINLHCNHISRIGLLGHYMTSLCFQYPV